MSVLPFQTCWDRVARAEIHRQSLIKIWDSIDLHETYTSRAHIRNDGTGEFFITSVNRDWLLPFSLQFGEFLYQLRGALDSCVYDAAILKFGQDPPPDKEKWEFVFGADSAKFDEVMRRMRKIIPDDVRGLIEAVQPYKGATCRHDGMEWSLGQTLMVLNDWARIDRHRKLHLVGTAITGGFLRSVMPSPMSIEYCNFVIGDVLENESKVADFKIANMVPNTNIHMQPNFTFEITVDETPRVRLQEIATAMSLSVQAVRESFERHFNIQRG